MDSKVRVGVIGLGIMGEQYVRVYQDHPYAEVVAVASRSLEKAQQVAAKFAVPHPEAHWQDLVARKDIDAVCVATPDDLHHAPALAAMEHGKHVLIEKPMTTNLNEADSLVTAAERTGVKVQVAFNHRWLASYHHGRIAIENGKIGQPLVAYARKNDTIFVPTKYINWAAQTSPAWFLSCHDIDLVRWFMGSDPVEVRAWGVKKVLAGMGIDTYDAIQSQVRFANGGIATFEACWIYPNTFPTIVDSFVEVIGEKGHLHFDRKRESIEISTEENFTFPKTFLSADIFGTLRGAYPACLSDFIRAIRDDSAPAVSVADGRQVTATLIAIHESLETGKNVSVPPLRVETSS